MATVTGLTAARMAEIEAASIVDGEVVGDNLILTKFDDTTINAGNVRGPQGDTGAAGADGVGLATGGSTGQVLAKVDGTDYNVAWQTINRLANVTLEYTTYKLVLTDAESIIMMYDTSPLTVQVPEDADEDFPVGTQISIVQAGTGEVSIAGNPITGGGNVTVTAPDPYLPTLLGLGAKVDLIKLGPNSWVLVGNGNLITSELGWRAFTPNIESSGSFPGLGSTAVKEGIYIVDSWKRVSGYATVRWSGASQSQGTGYYYMKLPQDYPAVNIDPEDYSPIGSISAGFSGLGHVHGMLHLNGWASPAQTNWAIGAMDLEGASFLAATIPSRGTYGDCGNIHYVFQYQYDDS